MTDVIKGTSGQNRYLVMTEQDARQIMSSVPNLKFHRCEQLGEFNSVLDSISAQPKIELCHKLKMIGTNYDSFLMSQFKDGILQMFFTGTAHYTAASNKLAEGPESAFYFTPAIYGIEFSGVKYSNLTANQAAASHYLKRFQLDGVKTEKSVQNFYINASGMYKNGAPKYSLPNDYENHLVTLLVNGEAIIIEKPKSLFIPQEEIISTAVGVSILRPSQVKEPVEEEPESEPEETELYFSIILIDKRSKPLTDVPYDLSFFKSEGDKNGEPIQKIKGGNSDAEGYVEHKLPKDAKFALLEYAPYPTRPDLILKMGLKVGELEDPSTESGMKSRLNHFGYFSGEEGIASNDSELFDAQLESFQNIYGLSGNDGVISYFENPTAIA
jgi:hypothetical protein